MEVDVLAVSSASAQQQQQRRRMVGTRRRKSKILIDYLDHVYIVYRYVTLHDYGNRPIG